MLSWKNDRRAVKYLVNAECRQNNQKISFYSEVSTCMTEIPYFIPATGIREKESQEWTWTVTPLFMESWKGETIASSPAVFYVMPPEKTVAEQETVPQTEEVEAENVSEEETTDEEESDELVDDAENSENEEIVEELTTEEVVEKTPAVPVKEPEKTQPQKGTPKTQEQKKPEVSEKSQEPEKTSTNESEGEIKFEEEIFVSSTTETTAAPEFEITTVDEDEVETMVQENKVIATEFTEKSRWITRTDKSTGGSSTASCDQIIVDYDGKSYSGIKFESQIKTSAVKLSSTLFMNSIQLPDSLQGSKGLIFKAIGDGEDYTLRIGVGNIEYGCKLKTKKGEVLVFDIPYSLFRQQTGDVLVPLDSEEITGITLSPSVPFPGDYEITIFDMNAK